MNKRRYRVGGRNAGTLHAVWHVVNGLTDSIEELPGFFDLDMDDPAMRIYGKLREVLCIAANEPAGPVRDLLDNP